MLKTRSLLLVTLLLTPLAVIAQRDSVMYGVASYYHSKFNGRKTSNGEIFRNDSLTAAHKYLPFGTRVKVTNLTNDSSVIVRINDRLPQSSKRSIDLSQAAAGRLNMMKAGIVKAKIEILPSMKESVPLADTVLVAVTHDTLTHVRDSTLQERAPITASQVKADTTHRDGSFTIVEESVNHGKGYTYRSYKAVRNGEAITYQKNTDPKGKITYRKNGQNISEEQFKKETGIE